MGLWIFPVGAPKPSSLSCELDYWPWPLLIALSGLPAPVQTKGFELVNLSYWAGEISNPGLEPRRFDIFPTPKDFSCETSFYH